MPGDIEARAAELGLDVTQNHLNDPRDPFPFADERFKLAVCVQVLMHFPLEFVVHTVGEMLLTASKAVIITTVALPEKSKGKHVFVHDYESIFERLGGQVEVRSKQDNTGCFFVTKV